jgi:ferredoxin
MTPSRDSQSTITVSVDRSRCAGHGVCLIHAPHVFDLDHESISTVIDEAPSDPVAVRRAEENCPERAITVKEKA